MMKRRMYQLRVSSGLAIVSLAAALSGCVSYGNTHALITPVGAVGYHTFKPDNRATPRDINLPQPDRVATTNDKDKQQNSGDQTSGD